MRRPLPLVLGGLALLAALAPPRAAAQTTGTCTLGQAQATLDVGDVRARLYNNGGLFWKGAGNVYNVPKSPLSSAPSPNAIFSHALWVGGYVGTEIRQAATVYGDWEFYPGPLNADGSLPNAADCSTYDRIWTVSTRDVRTYEATGQATADLAAWPVALGAPVVNGDGVAGNYNLAGGDRPEIRGHQTAFWVMNDVGGTHRSTGSKPIGLEVRVTAHAFRTGTDALDQATVYRYTLVKRGPGAFTDAWLGFSSDTDLGDASDDYVGSDTTLGLVYTYNADDLDGGPDGYGAAPPALGFRLLGGPPVIDTDRDGLPDRAGLTRFVFYTGDSSNHGNPRNNNEDWYYYLRGQWRDRSFVRACSNGDATTFNDAIRTDCGPYAGRPATLMFPGDPVTRAFWSEFKPTPNATAANAPSDRRFVFSTGPFALASGESQTFTLAIVYGRGTDHLNSVTKLREVARSVQATYDATGFLGLNEAAPLASPALAPRVFSPDDGVTGQPGTLRFRWEGVPNADAYELAVRHVDSTRAVTYQTLGGDLLAELAEGSYRWQVRGYNDGGFGPWSPERTVTVGRAGYARFGFANFLTVSNAAGPIPATTPQFGAMDPNHRGFPRGGAEPLDQTAGVQQSTNNSRWGIHTADTDATDEGYTYFLARVLRDGANAGALRGHDYEWRFTGSSKAVNFFAAKEVYDVPFELWDVGTTPADPADDVRLVPYVNPVAGGQVAAFDLGGDHPTSGGTDDPQTDEVYWMRPADETPGQAGYAAAAAQMTALGAAYNGEGVGEEVLARTVLVSWNGGPAPAGPFTAALPEPGTTFRVVTVKTDPTPVASAPANGAGVGTRQALLYWQEPPDVTRRFVELATDAGFANVVVRDSAATEGRLLTPDLAPGTTYHWRVRVRVGAGRLLSPWSAPSSFTAGSLTDAAEAEAVPTALVLRPVAPNPAATTARVAFGLPTAGRAAVALFDVLGRRVATLADGAFGAGWHTAAVEADRLAPGVYVVRVEAGGRAVSRPLVVAR